MHQENLVLSTHFMADSLQGRTPIVDIAESAGGIVRDLDRDSAQRLRIMALVAIGAWIFYFILGQFILPQTSGSFRKLEDPSLHLFCLAGVILSECIGRTNWSPLSGMTLIAVTILIIVSRNMSDSGSIIASVTVGAAACVAMAQATDLMMDMNCGSGMYVNSDVSIWLTIRQ